MFLLRLMNAPKVSNVDYIQFLIPAQRVYICTGAARCAEIASYDAYTRFAVDRWLQ